MGKGLAARAAVLTVCAALMGEAMMAPAEAALRPREKMLRLINRSRTQRDLRPLRLHRQVTRVAHRHSLQMANRREIFSSQNLPRAIRRWAKGDWGENVTCGRSLRSVHRRFMGRVSSRRNILQRNFRRVGIGIVETDFSAHVCRGGNVWVTEIFFT